MQKLFKMFECPACLADDAWHRLGLLSWSQAKPGGKGLTILPKMEKCHACGQEFTHTMTALPTYASPLFQTYNFWQPKQGPIIYAKFVT